MGGFAGFFRSAASGFKSYSSDDDEFSSDGYYSMSDQESQSGYDKRWQSPAGIKNAWSSASGYFKMQAEEPAPKVGFFQGARQNGLMNTLTPGFLRNDQDEDFASTCCPNLGLKQRIFLCACCFLAGQLLQFFAVTSSAGVLVGHPGRFARCYSMGNMMMLTGSFFLSGPRRQCNKIREKNRLVAFSAFVLSQILTLTVVYKDPFWGRALLILALVVTQWCAQVWYILSYIPYGHTIGRRVAKQVLGCCCPM